MEEKLQQHISFHLTGRHGGDGFELVTANHRPALLARYADLAALRYDFPLILNNEGAADRAVLSLSRLVDDVVERLSDDPGRDRIARHGYRLEREIRHFIAEKRTGDFASIWAECTARLAVEDETIQISSDLLWAEFFASGDVIDVDKVLPARVISHIWNAVQKQKARAFREKTERLLYKLQRILEAEFEGSQAGRSPERLKASVGASFSKAFDFDALSTFVNESKQAVSLSGERRSRLKRLIEVFENQHFFPLGPDAPAAYGFEFDNCDEAVRAYSSRLAEAAELLKTIAIAELETNGEYREAVHDAIFEGFGGNGLDADELAKLPDYLITVNTATLDPEERAQLAEILSTGLPFKVLVETDDILESPAIGARIGLGSISREFVNAAIGLTDVFVFQSAASDLFKSRELLKRGLTFDGAALFSVFSGANDYVNGLPPYLVAAAAVESRAFPSFVYDPSAGTTWASRFSVSENPNAELDWPVYDLEFEDGTLQARSETVEFTLADFIAMDERYGTGFAIVPVSDWHEEMVSVNHGLETADTAMPETVPTIWLIDGEFRLCRALVDAKTLRDVQRCLNIWQSLQELGGIKNSFVEKMIARGGRSVEEVATPAATETQAVAVDEKEAALEPTPSAASEINTDEPFIESARCTSCNECTQVNNKMFAYNADKQAYIADPDAGTFRQLVEAAESCQVSIIHPGKPRNPREPGLEDLIERAKPFN